MHITDKQGMQHHLGITDRLTIDEHLVGRLRRHGNSVTVFGFSIPEQWRGKGIGSAVVRELERSCTQRGVNEIRILVDEKTCPVHAHFWTKHGYTHTGSTWHRTIKQSFMR